MSQREIINKQRTRRRNRVRQRVQGTSERPRLTVFRSLRHISAQVIDDDTGRTLAAASTEQKEIGGSLKSTRTIEAAEAIGKAIAERAKSAGVSKVAFDRGHYRYHGRIAALAKAARDGGLAF